MLRTMLEYMETVKSLTKRKTKFQLERFCLIVLDEHPEQESVKTVQVKDKIIRDTVSNMDFFSLMEKMRL